MVGSPAGYRRSLPRDPEVWRVGNRHPVRPRGAESTVNRIISSRQFPGRGEARASSGDCREFLDRYSDYRDGRLGDDGRSFFIGHLARCTRCRRYDRVIRKGVDVLRKNSQGSPRSRLTVVEARRLAAAFDKESLALGSAGSGVTIVAAGLVALLMAAVAWSPFFSGRTPEVAMPPVVAGAPSPPTATTLSSSETIGSPELRDGDLGEVFRTMLIELRPGLAQEAEADPE